MAIKKGRRDGTTEFAHRINPFFAEERLGYENINKDTINVEIHTGINRFFNLNTINFILYKHTSYIFILNYYKDITKTNLYNSGQNVKKMLYYVSIYF